MGGFDVTYPKQTIPIRTTGGLVSDVPAWETGMDYLSQMFNAIVRSGFVQRVHGSRSVYATALATVGSVWAIKGKALGGVPVGKIGIGVLVFLFIVGIVGYMQKERKLTH